MTSTSRGGQPHATVSPGVRVSDADRDATIQTLNESVAVGRLTPEEHAERVEAALRAKTAGDLSVLTRDLVLPVSRRPRSMMRRLLLPLLVVLVAAVTTGSILAVSGTSTTSPATSLTTSQATRSSSDGFVQPEPSVAGRFCRGLLTSQRADRSVAGVLGTAPGSDPWGTQTLIVPAHPSPTFVQDFATVQSLENATSVVQMAWQKSGYQYSELTLACLSAYDSHFHWIPAGDSSNGSSDISVSYSDRHSLLAAKSASGTCWYELNVMGPGDPVIAQDDLQSYGVFFSKGGARCAADAASSYADWELADPLPPQLGQ